MTQNASTLADVGYATPIATPRPSSRTLAGALLLFGGLALVVLAGCFLIGIMITIQHIGPNGAAQQLPLTPAEIAFIAVLGVLALAALAGAVLLLFLGTRALLRITTS